LKKIQAYIAEIVRIATYRYYDDLSEDEKAIFERLLVCQDPELFAWFMGHEQCEDKELNSMVQLILKRIKL